MILRTFLFLTTVSCFFSLHSMNNQFSPTLTTGKWFATNFHGQQIVIEARQITSEQPLEEKTRNTIASMYADKMSSFFDPDILCSSPWLMLYPFTWGAIFMDLSSKDFRHKTELKMYIEDLNNMSKTKKFYLITAHYPAREEDQGLIGWMTIKEEQETGTVTICDLITKRFVKNKGIENLLTATLFTATQQPSSLIITLNSRETTEYERLGFKLHEAHIDHSATYTYNPEEQQALQNIAATLQPIERTL